MYMELVEEKRGKLSLDSLPFTQEQMALFKTAICSFCKKNPRKYWLEFDAQSAGHEFRGQNNNRPYLVQQIRQLQVCR